jgi:thiamine-phosphate pyrophosphorylase
VPQPDFDLYLVSDRKLTQGKDLLWVLEQALDGGVRAIQLREKDLGGKELFELADKTAVLCQRYNAHLFVNDRVDVALAVDAAGVQLGSSSIPLETARALLGPNKQISVSTHCIDEAKEAQSCGADFVLFGPVYFTPSKASFGEPQGLAALKKVVENVSLPVYAIGGVKPANLPEVKRTGIRGVALISAIISAANPTVESQRILQLLQE